MSTPRHRTAPGTSYFVTTKCWQGRPIFQVPENAGILLKTLLHYRKQGAYQLHEFVVMPDHLHLLLTPSPTISLEKALQLIKGGASHEIHKEREQRMEIWQQGFYDWTIRDLADWQVKVDYIRMNPVRAKLAERLEDWPYSSANDKFQLDPIPVGLLKPPSGAKARAIPTLSSELKLRPPEERQT